MNNKVLVIGGVIVLGVGFLIVGALYNDKTQTIPRSSQAPTLTPTAQISASVSETAMPTEKNPNLAPDFTLQRLSGGTITLAEFRGVKPVVLDFWASWCPNCQRDMPKLNGMYEKYKDDIEVIGINLQERESTVKQFVLSKGISFSIALDPLRLASNAFGVQYTNTHLLIDKNGAIVKVIPGDIRENDIISLIKQ
ncbi:MAG: Alkyl hydroperoxide reductase/ Thiol specific antioxidant/ Mal allergen [Parcubacteria group bacterium GW2011_GWA2_47_8]|nr:MAG: Alkyl hydroperoxide reductase/ Thiol specific antioxidant/ Mal allergen [Parcubacteria group bacterium GW2011_GWA2_47_8]OHB18349.1 MAG: hypothetical protein A2666_02890 [Parcubacteria group bacterium RIFCSPHIGHO2_01_FULL_47_10b]